MSRSERDRREVRQFIDEVKRRIWAWDPVGLVSLGVPEDEYDCLMAPVSGGLRQGLTADALADTLKEFISGHFGHEASAIDARKFADSIVDWYSSGGKPTLHG